MLTILFYLKNYVLRGIINDWFHSYPTDRLQSIQIGSEVSTKLPIVCGVPQGSLVGSLSFLLYVNDLYRSSAKLTFYFFANDTNQ